MMVLECSVAISLSLLITNQTVERSRIKRVESMARRAYA